MSPKGPCVKGLATSLQHYWEVVELLRDGAERKKVRGCIWERYWDPGPFLSLYFAMR
jgi:hypothetical protein